MSSIYLLSEYREEIHQPYRGNAELYVLCDYQHQRRADLEFWARLRALHEGEHAVFVFMEQRRLEVLGKEIKA